MRPENPPQDIIIGLAPHHVSEEKRASIIFDNQYFLAFTDAVILTKTIRNGVNVKDYRPFVFFDEPDISSQLQNYYNYFKDSFEIQTKLKTVAVNLIKGWRNSEEGYWAIEDYAVLAAYWQTSEAIPDLIAATDELIPSYDNCSTAKESLTKVVAVLAGFTPDETVFQAFEKWFQNHSFPWQNKAQLVVGLIRCQPTNWQKYLLDLLEIEKEHPCYFRWDYLGGTLGETINIEELSAIAGKIPEKIRTSFQKGLDFARQYKEVNE